MFACHSIQSFSDFHYEAPTCGFSVGLGSTMIYALITRGPSYSIAGQGRPNEGAQFFHLFDSSIGIYL